MFTTTCPNCRKKTKYSPNNPYRPFCSKQCRMADLGSWFSEDYRFSSPLSPDEEYDVHIEDKQKTEYLQ